MRATIGMFFANEAYMNTTQLRQRTLSPTLRSIVSGRNRSQNLLLLVVLFFFFGLSIITPQPSGLRVFRSSIGTTATISRHGITWYFGRDVEYGQFVNGDYWVIGPVSIVGIDPMSINTSGRVINGSMVNPSHGQSQGFDSAPNAGGFSTSNNVGRPEGRDLTPDNPLLLQPGSSLVSTRSAKEAGSIPIIIDAAVLTVVEIAPPQGSFRPPYSGMDKQPRWDRNDIRWNLWNDNKVDILPQAVANMPAISTMERRVERVWLDYMGGTWTGRSFHPANNMQDYGQRMAHESGEIALALLLDIPQSEIETLMIRYLQLGIDWYGVMKAAPSLYFTSTQGHFWYGGGGHGHGRKWPMLFAGIMLNDTDILEFTNAGGYRHRWNSPDWVGEPGHPVFQEEQQTFYVTQEDVDQARHDADGRYRQPYTESMIGLPEWGESHVANPRRDGANWSVRYRDIMSNSIMGHVLAAIMFINTGQNGATARELWNWEAIFDYTDRWVSHRDDTSSDEFGAHGRLDGGANRARQFFIDMWDTYRERADYLPQWKQ